MTRKPVMEKNNTSQQEPILMFCTGKQSVGIKTRNSGNLLPRGKEWVVKNTVCSSP